MNTLDQTVSMERSTAWKPSAERCRGAQGVRRQQCHARALRLERLPFKIYAAGPSELTEIAALRADAYGHHLPEFGTRLREAEPADLQLGNVVLVARGHEDGKLLGSMRIHTNAERPLPLESSITLPDRFRGARLAEATRLCTKRQPESSLVRNALFKSFFLFGLDQLIDSLLIAGRPPLDRMYERLHFLDVFESGRFYPLKHAANLSHRIMAIETMRAEDIWEKNGHLLFDFAFRTYHPDIHIRAPSNF